MEWIEARDALGREDMDATHREFVALANAAAAAAAGPAFADAFGALLAHTEAHFAAEDARMDASGFPARAEHVGEHRRVLADLRRFDERISKGSSMMARAWLREQVPGWFALHLATMDAALAAHLAARDAATAA